VKIGIVSDGQYGERAYEQIRKQFFSEWILLPFPHHFREEEGTLVGNPGAIMGMTIEHMDRLRRLIKW
jgi:hypothetical protein